MVINFFLLIYFIIIQYTFKLLKQTKNNSKIINEKKIKL